MTPTAAPSERPADGAPGARFIAFYSFKGGVGRTLALANCARALAQRGRTVAVLDLDLEAPGLGHFDAFRPAAEGPTRGDAPLPELAGFAEYLADCINDAPPASLADYLHRCRGKPGDKGAVYLMPAGKRGGDAYRKALVFDWDRFYAEQDGYRILENLRGHMAHNLGGDDKHPIRPDYVLIDSRTGLSETGGIATHQLADLVVLLFGLNRQNLDGTAWVHDSLAALLDPPRMLLVVSPLPEIMETGEGTLFAARRASIRKRLAKAVNADRPARLPYRPVLSWDEVIMVDSDDAEYLSYDKPYLDLLQSLLEVLKDRDTFMDRAMAALRANRQGEARKALEAGLDANPDDPVLSEALARLGGKQGPRVDLGHLPAGPKHFLGRGPELIQLDQAWTSGRATSVVELIAPGGTGKTALVKRWLDGLRAPQSGSGSQSPPEPITLWQGATQVLGWSFYSQDTTEDRQASEDLFLAVAIERFGIEIDPAANPADKGRALAEALINTRILLILDGLEPLQYPPGPLAGQLRAPGLKALLCGIAAAGQAGLCVVTSRERLQDLAEWVRTPTRPAGSVLRIDLGNLNQADGAALLHAAGADHAGTVAIGPDDPELRAAATAVRGHALTLSLLGGYLRLAHGGDIRRRDQVQLQEADAESGAGHVARVLAAYEHWLARDAAPELAALRLFGLFDRPAAPALLDALRAPPPIPGLTEALTGSAGFQPARAPRAATALEPAPRLWRALRRRQPPTDAEPAGSRRSPDARWQIALSRLEQLRLIAPPDADGVRDAHPLIREHLGATLRERFPAAWREGHRRLYERLKTDTPHRPDGLSGLQPLYQTVAHGCQAGRWQEALDEVYFDRILRGTGHDGFYSLLKLGAFGADLSALAHLFAEPWRRPVPALSAPTRAWLLNHAGLCLRALGRLVEALEPMRAGAEMAVEQQDWKNAAIYYGNLSELQLALGRIDAAVADARRSVEHADRSGDAFLRMVIRTTLADALHQQGEAAAANAAFAEAEAMQAEWQPQYPLLYSLQGFRYCDLLLAAAERAAWSGPGADPRAGGGDGSSCDNGVGERDGAGAAAGEGDGAGLVAVCTEVARRAGQTLEWAEKHFDFGPLDIALDHLTLARCALYSDRLQGRPPGPEARDRAERALDRLRASGREDFIPLGLLTRARIRHAQGDRAGADADLREAERIAERGAMALHLADLALTRARLFADPEALTRARRLIAEHGYRRLPELEDAEAAVHHWPQPSTNSAPESA